MHMRKHVREGICLEICSWRTEHKREFINVRHYAKVGTQPAIIIFKEWYVLTPAIHVEFRYENDNKWLKGIITDVNKSCIFINLF